MASMVDRREVQKLLVVAGAIRAGLIDALAGPGEHTVAEVADRADADERATGIVLDALLDLGVLEGGRDAFRLSEGARRSLVDPGPDYERDSILHQVSIVSGWLALPTIIKEGRPPAGTGGGRRDLRAFVRTMAEGDPAILEEVADHCLDYAGLGRVRRMLDVGGAVGHVALTFARRGVSATVCDRSEVLAEAQQYLTEQGQSGAVELATCDFRVALPVGSYDLVYLGNVYHIYGTRTNAELTERVFGKLAPGGVIAIRDLVYERSPRSALFAVNMLQATEEGGVWREEQYRDWLVRAGFVDVEVVDLQRSHNQLVLGRRAEPSTTQAK